MKINLNDNQKLAVSHNEGPMIVFAGPGSGKTMVITYRVVNLISKYNIRPENILVITFTKSAAIEMKDRYDKITKDKNNKITFGTFHSIFFRILKSYYNLNINQILMEDKKRDIIKKIIKKLQIECEDENEFIGEIVHEMSFMKSELAHQNTYDVSICPNEEFHKILDMYEEYKQSNKLIDFDDMLVKCYELLNKNKQVLNYWQNKYKYILIDEFQDINRAQYEIIKMLAKPNNNLFIVGDDDQSIYQFRGARPEFLLNFPKEYKNAQRIVLNKNYRSTKNIVDVSKCVIKNNKNRYIKNMITDNTEGREPTIMEAVDVGEEAKLIAQKIASLTKKEDIPLSDIAIIYRTNIQSRAIINMFLDMNIPFVVRDKAAILYDHWIARDMIAYMKLSQNVMNKECLIRIINKPKRYIRKVDIEAAKNSDNMWTSLYKQYIDKEWMLDRLENLQYQLQIIRNKRPFEIIEYIRNTIGYEEYLINYAEYRKMNVSGLMEILDEIGESTKNYNTIDEWFNHIDEYRQMMKENDKYNKVNNNSVTLTTMHSSKGLEFKFVWIISVVEDLIPHKKADIEEERRLFYVSMTRAKDILYISHIKNRFGKKTEPSRFLKELYKHYVKNLDEGKNIEHIKFGMGKIVSIDESFIYAKFDSKGEVKLDTKFCVENNLIKLIDK